MGLELSGMTMGANSSVESLTFFLGSGSGGGLISLLK